MRSRDLIPSRRAMLAIVVACIAMGLLSFSYRGLDDLAREHSGRMTGRFVEEMTSALSGALLLPFAVWFARRFKVTRSALWTRLPIHLLAATAWSGTLTTLRWISRAVIFPLAGLGEYDYGIIPIRYAMEFPNDLVWYGVFVVFVHLFDEYREAREREVRTAQLEARLAQAQLHALRLQLQPHFLFNTLNTISSIVYEDPRAADEMIARLSDLLRATLRTSNQQEVTLDEELRYLDLYVEIMRARFDDRLVVSFDVDPTTRDALVPQLLLQPLVENAIRHGASADATSTIAVSARREGGGLVLEVRDRGRGLAVDASEAVGRGVGLSNTVERLERLYGAAHAFALRDADGGGLAVNVMIPFRTAAAGY
jgi:two-component system, LytTR family, sensor kinase